MADAELLTCVNCEGALLGSSLLYCSEACSQEAGYVRYHRQVLRDGRSELPEIQEALRIRRVVVLNGGYPYERRALPKHVREMILARDHWTCQRCGNPGYQVDHIHVRGINRNVNHPLNLQVLCADCHRDKTIGDIRLISKQDDPELWTRLHKKSRELDRRVSASPAERLCDDDERWPAAWRPLQAERRALLATQQATRGRKAHLRLVK